MLPPARLAYLAVEARHGPHVTPHRYTVADGLVWLVVPRGSLKARAVRKHGRAGVLLSTADRALAVTGRARVLPFLTPTAAVTYAGRNAPALVGLGLDVPQLPRLPLDRVAIAVTPGRCLRLDNGDLETARVHLAVPDGLPADIAALAATPGPAVVGWETEHGPLALPATWSPETATAHVPAVTDQHRISVTLDRSAGMRASRYRGLILQGHGHAAWWNGFVTGSIPATAHERVA
jgi:hypothetical protein